MPEFDATISYAPTPSLPAQLYRVGSDGSVWSRRKKGHAWRGGPWTQLKGARDSTGYQRVCISVNGKRSDPHIHRLVLEAFIGPCPEGMQCCHYDGSRSNNRLDNLRWDTPAANQADRVRHGTDNRGSKAGPARLTEQDIPVIRDRLLRETMSRIARDYRVTRKAITDIRNGRTWRHV